VSKDPDIVMVVTRAFPAKHALGLDRRVESGSASDDHHLIVRASSRNRLLK